MENQEQKPEWAQALQIAVRAEVKRQLELTHETLAPLLEGRVPEPDDKMIDEFTRRALADAHNQDFVKQLVDTALDIRLTRRTERTEKTTANAR